MKQRDRRKQREEDRLWRDDLDREPADVADDLCTVRISDTFAMRHSYSIIVHGIPSWYLGLDA